MTRFLYYPDIKSLDGLPVYSVGWLGWFVFWKGDVEEAVLERLWWCAHVNSQWAAFGVLCGAWGSHTCGICGRYDSHGEIVVSTARAHYLVPTMIFHYIEAHRYKPPKRFIADLLTVEMHPFRELDLDVYGPVAMGCFGKIEY